MSIQQNLLILILAHYFLYQFDEVAQEKHSRSQYKKEWFRKNILSNIFTKGFSCNQLYLNHTEYGIYY